MTNGEYTRSEISSQPETWKATLEGIPAQSAALTRFAPQLTGSPLLATGCGSTYYLSLIAATALRQVGVPASAFPASELVYFPYELFPREFNLLCISRSGTTSETLWAIERYRKQFPNGKLISICCNAGTPMVAACDAGLLSPTAMEKSVAQTRTFTSMVLMALALAGLLVADTPRLERLSTLPSALEKLLERVERLPETLGRDLSLQRFFFLGNGPLYGIACEAMLKTKEMTCSWAEAYHTLEFRHGPMSVVNSESLVVGFLSDSASDAELKVLRQMKSLGARILAFSEHKEGFDWNGIDHVVELNSGLSEWERGVLCLPFIQWMAFHRALAKGLDPDNPNNLTQVVYL